MKLNKIFTAGGRRIRLTSDTWVLEQNAAGRAIAVVISDEPLSGACSLAIGYDDQLERWFTGYITGSVQLDRHQQRLTISETSAVLAKRWTVSRRNVAAVDVLRDLGTAAGVGLNTGAGADWLERLTPHFVNMGTGYDLLDAFGRIYRIPDYCWIPQADGSIYVGNYFDAAASKKILAISESFFTELSATGAGCAVVTTFRPGCRIRIGNSEALRLHQVTLTGNNMRINFA